MAAVALLNFWPLLLLPEGQAGIVIAVFSMAFCGYVYALPTTEARVVKVWFPALALCILVYVSLVSIPINDADRMQFLIYASTNVTVGMAFAKTLNIEPRTVVGLGLLLLTWRQFGSVPEPGIGNGGSINTLVQGQVAWFTALFSLGIRNRYLRWTVLLFSGYSLLTIPTSGPLVGAAASFSVLLFDRARGKFGAKITGFVVGSTLAAAAVRDVQIELENVPDAANSSRIRLKIWQAVIDEGSLIGRGWDYIEFEQGIFSTNAHNILLDAVWSAGLVGLSLLLLAIVASVRDTKFLPEPMYALQLGILVSLLFSGSLTGTVYLWIALGIGAGYIDRTQQGMAAVTPTRHGRPAKTPSR